MSREEKLFAMLEEMGTALRKLTRENVILSGFIEEQNLMHPYEIYKQKAEMQKREAQLQMENRRISRESKKIRERKPVKVRLP